MKPDDAKQTIAAWNGIASGFDRFVTATHFELGEQAVRRAGIGEGTRFLDVACGSGALSIPAARAGAEVTATDISPAMVDLLNARARAEGLSNVDARVMDGHSLDLDDETFDVSGSQFGVMLFPDMPQGLRELTRVTKRGGKVLLVVFGPPEQVEFLTFFVEAMKAVAPGFAGLPTNPPPLPFQCADPERLQQRFAEAGLEDVKIETVTEAVRFSSGKEMWDWLLNSNPIPGEMTSELSDDQKVAVRKRLNDMLLERAGDDGSATLRHPVHIAVARKPG